MDIQVWLAFGPQKPEEVCPGKLDDWKAKYQNTWKMSKTRRMTLDVGYYDTWFRASLPLHRHGCDIWYDEKNHSHQWLQKCIYIQQIIYQRTAHDSTISSKLQQGLYFTSTSILSWLFICLSYWWTKPPPPGTMSPLSKRTILVKSLSLITKPTRRFQKSIKIRHQAGKQPRDNTRRRNLQNGTLDFLQKKIRQISLPKPLPFLRPQIRSLEGHEFTPWAARTEAGLRRIEAFHTTDLTGGPGLGSPAGGLPTTPQKEGLNKDTIPIGSMGLEYWPTWIVDFYGKCR